MVESKPQTRFMLFEEGSKEEKKQNELYAAAKRQQCCSGVWEDKPEERQKTLGSKDWDRVYSYEEKRLKSYIEGEEYGDWEKQNRSWELENGLVPLLEEEKQQTLGSKDWDRVYSYEEKRLKSYIEGEEYGDWEKQNRSWELENGLVPLLEEEKQQTLGSKDWDRVYSYEEKRLKSYIEGEEYGDWEKKNRSWELENGLVPLLEEEKQQTLGSKDWDRVYSYEEKRLKSYIEGEEYGDWEKQNRSWELENGLVPLLEEEKQQTLGSKDWDRVYSYEEKRLKSYIEGEEYGDWEKQNRSWELENGLVPLLEVEKQQTLGSKDWDRVYSYEEKRLKSYIEGEEYGDWEKQNRSWELENGLVPLPEERGETVRIYFSPETARFFSPEAALEEQKKQTEAYNNRLLELSTKVLTEEEKKLKESYLQKWENWRLGLSKETFFPFGPGWDLAWYTELPENSTVELLPLPPPPPPPQARPKVPLTLEDLQHLCQNQPPTPEISWEDDREKLAAEGRCLDGSYLTPYCKCDRKCYQFDTVLKNEPPESLPIWLAYCRQYRQSHCFDIDDYMGGVCPLTPYQNFDGRLELLMELANLAIQEYNEKECNVFKYKVMKIEKANCCVATNAYWMTVKVSNLTLCSVIETFQIHAVVNFVTQKKIIFCCRPKEEVITGLPLCEFCFGLLPGEVGTSSEEEFIVWKKELPGKFLSNANLWNDDDFLPKGTSEQHRDIFRQIYQEYFRQIIQSNGFDIDKYPGDARAAVYIPYLEFEKEADMLMELANHAIDDYNNRETSVFKYKIDYIEKVNVFLGECREYFMTVKVFNLALYRTIETVQIHAYKGPHEENIVSLCRKKVAI